MSEHIVARALRAQAAAIEEELAEPYMAHGSRIFLGRIRAQFLQLADQLHALERQLVFDIQEIADPAIREQLGVSGKPDSYHEVFPPIDHLWSRTPQGEQKPLHIEDPAGSRSGETWLMPSITITAGRLEKAAMTAYNRMAGAMRPQWAYLSWELLDERDRVLWREAMTDALRAALERDDA